MSENCIPWLLLRALLSFQCLPGALTELFLDNRVLFYGTRPKKKRAENPDVLAIVKMDTHFAETQYILYMLTMNLFYNSLTMSRHFYM